jgi:hypothetical protein
MTTLNKITRITELKKEMKTLKKGLKEEMIDFVIKSFKNKGFTVDPRKGYEERSLYNPTLKVSVRIVGLNEVSVSISAHLMKNDGMNWDDRQKIHSEVNWNFTKKTFDKYYDTTFKSKVERIKEFI